MAATDSTWGGLPIGDWATWAGSTMAGISLVLLAWGRLRDGRRTYWQARSDQARQVGAWIEFGEQRQGDRVETRVTMRVMNTSPLAIRGVRGYAVGPPPRVVAMFPELAVVAPGPAQSPIWISDCPAILNLVLVYNDDAGVRWRKYGITITRSRFTLRPKENVIELDDKRPDLDGWA